MGLIPLYLLHILPDLRHERVVYLITRARRHPEDDLIERRRPEDVDVVCRRPAAPRNRGRRLVRKLPSSLLISSSRRRNSQSLTHLDRHDLDPRGVPPLVLPALDAHGAEAEEVHRAVALADAHAVEDARELALVGVLGVDLGAQQEGQVERRAGRGAVGDVGALGVWGVRLNLVVLVSFAAIPVPDVSIGACGWEW